MSLTILKELGFGRNIMESRIQEEVTSLVSHIRGFNGQSRDLRHSVDVSVSNVICSILMGKRFPLGDCDDLRRTLRLIDSGEDMVAKLVIVDFFPLLAHLPSYKRCVQQMVCENPIFLDFFKSVIAEHTAVHHDGQNDDFIHAYMTKMGADYNAEHLLYILRDLFVGGSDTTASTLEWAIVYMANNPAVQV